MSITGPAAPPQNIQTIVQNSTSISVFWDPPPFPDRNGVITGYQVVITNLNRSNVSEVINVTSPSHVATDLQEFEAYNIKVAAMTAIGLGPFSAAVRNQTLEDSKCFSLQLGSTVVSSTSNVAMLLLEKLTFYCSVTKQFSIELFSPITH